MTRATPQQWLSGSAAHGNPLGGCNALGCLDPSLEILISWHRVWTEQQSFEGSTGNSNVQPHRRTSWPRERPTGPPTSTAHSLISSLWFSEFEEPGFHLEGQLETREDVFPCPEGNPWSLQENEEIQKNKKKKSPKIPPPQKRVKTFGCKPSQTLSQGSICMFSSKLGPYQACSFMMGFCHFAN